MIFDVPSLNHRCGRLAVLMGGVSAEREVSLRSGSAVVAALASLDIPVISLDLTANYVQQLLDAQLDTAFIMLHGSCGEDGKMQAVLEGLGVRYTGSGVLASATAMHKWYSKKLFRAANLSTPPAILLTAANLSSAGKELGFPLAIKPASGGSSLGVSKVTRAAELAKAYKLSRQYDSCVIAEEWIEGQEFAVAVLDAQVLPLIRIEVAGEFYDYRAKYAEVSTRYILDHALDSARVTAMQNLALAAFNTLGCVHYGRIDMLLDKQGKIWLIEVNTVPGMTQKSLFPMAAKAAGISMPNLVAQILALLYA